MASLSMNICQSRYTALKSILSLLFYLVYTRTIRYENSILIIDFETRIGKILLLNIKHLKPLDGTQPYIFFRHQLLYKILVYNLQIFDILFKNSLFKLVSEETVMCSYLGALQNII